MIILNVCNFNIIGCFCHVVTTLPNPMVLDAEYKKHITEHQVQQKQRTDTHTGSYRALKKHN